MPRRQSSLVIDMPPATESVAASAPAVGEWLEPAMFYGMIVLLMFSPLAFGATQPWSQFTQRTLAVVLLALWIVRQCVDDSIELSKNPLYLPAAIFFVLVVAQFATGATVYRYATLTEAQNLLPCGVVLLLAGELLTRRRRLRDFVLAMAAFGFVVALIAVFQDVSNTDKIYGIVPVHHLSVLFYGPYPNHNHYAGLMEMLTPLAAAAAFVEHGAKRYLLLFATVLMAASIVLSRSRGGMLGLGMAIIFACVVLFRSDRERRAGLVILAITAAIAIVVLFLANDKVVQRLTETQDNYRLAIYRDCLKMWLNKPLFGFGWGTFPTIYPAYRSFYTDLFVNHAHNDYLETLVEMGLAGAALALWFLFGVAREGWRKLSDKNDREGSTLAFGVMAGILALLAHSALDFNLHIPANAVLFYALCSAAATPFKHRVRQVVVAPVWTEEEEVEPIFADGPA